MVALAIRDAQLGDAERIGAIQVRAWQAAYRGVMPDAYLDELDVDDRAAFWRRQVLALLPGQRLEVIVDDGVVVGFAAAGPEHDGRAAGIGELYAINLDPQVDDVRREDEVFGVVVPEMRYRRRLPTSGCP